MTKIEETSFFKKIWISIKDFEKYPELAIQKVTKVVVYVIKLMAIFAVIATMLSVYMISQQIQKAITYFEEEVPNLSLKDHVLVIDSEEPIVIENEDAVIQTIILDGNELNDAQIEAYQNKIKSVGSGIVFLKNRVFIYTGMTTGSISFSYEELDNKYAFGNLDKQDIIDYFSGSNLVMLLIGLFLMNYLSAFVAYCISILMDAILLAILGYTTAILLRLRLKFSAMYNMAVHSLTLPILLNLIYMIIRTFTGFQIKYFEIMYIGIAYIYIIAGILMIKSDIIKKQQELTKIIEEQEKVKQELERRQEEEERRKEEQEREKERRKQEEEEKRQSKRKKKDENEGETPQGEHA